MFNSPKESGRPKIPPPKQLPDPQDVAGRDFTKQELEDALIHMTEQRRTGEIYEPNLIELLRLADEFLTEREKKDRKTPENTEEAPE